MTYLFRRSYVSADGKGFLKGAVAPSEWPQGKIEALVNCDILYGVEHPDEFLENLGGDDSEELQKLDPEKKQPKAKKG